MQTLAALRSDIELITFDCYGTLIDWAAGMRMAFARVPALARLDADQIIDAYIRTEASIEQQGYQTYREIQALTLRALAINYCFPLTNGEAYILADTLPHWPPFADTNDALRRLKSRYRLGVLSNIDRDLFARTQTHFAAAFDLVVTAEDVRSYKPGHLHFMRMLEQTRGGRDVVLHVAQSLYHDGRPASELRLPFAWINRYGDDRAADVPMLGEFASLADLADALGV